MTEQQRAPKQRSLTKEETINTFENWRQNLFYTLSLDPSFTPFLEAGYTWEKKTAAHPNRVFVDYATETANRKTAIQKNAPLELMLG